MCFIKLGPLLHYAKKTGPATLIGVVSFGKGCAFKYYPGYYSRINHVLWWIKDELMSCNTCPPKARETNNTGQIPTSLDVSSDNLIAYTSKNLFTTIDSNRAYSLKAYLALLSFPRCTFIACAICLSSNQL